MHKSLRGQSITYVQDDFPRYYPLLRRLGSTVISRIFHRDRSRSWQFNYQTRNFALLFLLIRRTMSSSRVALSSKVGAWRIVSTCHVTLFVLPRSKVAFCVICYNYLLRIQTVLVLLKPSSESFRTLGPL